MQRAAPNRPVKRNGKQNRFPPKRWCGCGCYIYCIIFPPRRKPMRQTERCGWIVCFQKAFQRLNMRCGDIPHRHARMLHKHFYRPRTQRRMRRPERINLPFAGSAPRRANKTLGFPVQIRVVLPQKPAQTRYCIRQRRIDLTKHRYYRMPDAVARIAVIRICAVGHIVLP